MFRILYRFSAAMARLAVRTNRSEDIEVLVLRQWGSETRSSLVSPAKRRPHVDLNLRPSGYEHAEPVSGVGPLTSEYWVFPQPSSHFDRCWSSPLFPAAPHCLRLSREFSVSFSRPKLGWVSRLFWNRGRHDKYDVTVESPGVLDRVCRAGSSLRRHPPVQPPGPTETGKVRRLHTMCGGKTRHQHELKCRSCATSSRPGAEIVAATTRESTWSSGALWPSPLPMQRGVSSQSGHEA